MATNKYEWLKSEEDKQRLYEQSKALNEQAANLAVSLANNPASGAKTVSSLAKQKAVTPPATNTATPQAAVEAATTPSKELVSNDLLNEILNRKEFKYDYSTDPLYQQYREQYLTAGNKAMQDTLGKATALTGGYANSYANAAAQQTYDEYAARVADKIPELYQLAMQKYQMEGDLLNNKYSLLYGKERDAIADEQWQKSFDENVRQYDLSRADQREQFAEQMGLERDKFEESVRQFGIQHALEQAKFDRSKFESDRAFDYQKESDAKELAYKYYATDADNAYKYYAANLSDKTNNRELDMRENGTYFDQSSGNKNKTDLATEAAKYNMTPEEFDAYKAKFTGSVTMKKESDWETAVQNVADAMKNGTFHESSLYKYTFEQAQAIYEMAEQSGGSKNIIQKLLSYFIG